MQEWGYDFIQRIFSSSNLVFQGYTFGCIIEVIQYPSFDWEGWLV